MTRMARSAAELDMRESWQAPRFGQGAGGFFPTTRSIVEFFAVNEMRAGLACVLLSNLDVSNS